MSLNEERLKEMPFIDYLKYMHDRIKSLRHTPKSDYAYREARELCNNIKYRVVDELHLTWEGWEKRNLSRSEDILDLYNFKDSDKRKSLRISEFVSDYGYDLQNLLFAWERHQKDPDTPIEQQEL